MLNKLFKMAAGMTGAKLAIHIKPVNPQKGEIAINRHVTEEELKAILKILKHPDYQ